MRFSAQSAAKERLFRCGRAGTGAPGAPGGSRGTAGPSRRSRRPVSCRAAQYACAVAADALRRSGASAEALARARQLEAHLSLGRKRERGVINGTGVNYKPGPLAEPPAETGGSAFGPLRDTERSGAAQARLVPGR